MNADRSDYVHQTPVEMKPIEINGYKYRVLELVPNEGNWYLSLEDIKTEIPVLLPLKDIVINRKGDY